MIRLILFAWFALAAILLVATDLSEDHHLKQISSTYFAQSDNNGAEYQTRHTIRHHSQFMFWQPREGAPLRHVRAG